MADAADPVRPTLPRRCKRAQQGKSYWRRVWERLRDDKVTLAVIGVLVIAADHGRLRAVVHRARSLHRLACCGG